MTELTIPEMWYQIHDHQAFVNSLKNVELLIQPVMVNPETKCVESDPSINTELNYWIEFLIPRELNESNQMHYSKRDKEAVYHEYKLDCGGVTFEDAIRQAHKNFIEQFGLYNEDEYIKNMRKGFFPKLYSALDCYFKEDLFNFEMIKKDVEFMNEENQFEHIISYLISRFICTDFYCIYKNGIIDSNLDADCIVNYRKETYNIPYLENKNKSNILSVLKIAFRLFNIKSVELLYINEIVFINKEKHDEFTI